MIQLDKYFYEPDDYSMNKKEVGSQKETMNGTLFMQKVNEYKTFKMSFDGVGYEQVSQLEYIEDKCKPADGSTPQVIDFYDIYDDHYQVVIPLNGLSYTPTKGDNILFDIELELREKIN